MVAPLHLEVWTVFSSETETSVGSCTFGSLLLAVDTLPPLRIRRRFVPKGSGKVNFPGVGSAAGTEEEDMVRERLRNRTEEWQVPTILTRRRWTVGTVDYLLCGSII